MNNDEFLRAYAEATDEIFEETYGVRMGFAIIVFPFGSGVADYISNAQRENMIDTLRETADRIEKKDTIPPAEGSA